jgi:hypothetical protein
MTKGKLLVVVFVLAAFCLGFFISGQYSYYKFSNMVYSVELINFNAWSGLKLLRLHGKGEVASELIDYSYSASMDSVSILETENLSKDNRELLLQLKERINEINSFNK